jgi:hypothetical protein
VADEPQARRLAANEALAREVNRRVGEVAAPWYADDERLEFICECSYRDCDARVHVTMPEYTAVRASAQRFLLVAAHVNPEIERVVGEAGDAAVVEKIGPGREVADEMS